MVFLAQTSCPALEPCLPALAPLMKSGPNFSRWILSFMPEKHRLDETNRKVARERLLDAEINCALAKVRAHRAAQIIVKGRS